MTSDGSLPPLPRELDPRGRHRRSPRRTVTTGPGRHGVRLGGQILAAALSAVLLVTFGLYWWKYHAFSKGLNRLNVFPASAAKPRHDIDGTAQNVLIVGNDDRQTATDAELKQLGTGRDGGSLNTDTMMIVHVPANGAKAALISLPRDSYVAIPGYGMNKLNSAYADGYNAAAGDPQAKRAGGAKLLVQVVQNLTGLTIDHFVAVDLIGFYRISNAIGGVSVNMCAAVQDPKSGIDLHRGVNVVQGTQALAFVRQRYNFPNGLGDLDRVQRQRYFLTAAFRKLTSAGVLLNPIKLQSLLTAVQSSLYMDSSLDPLNLARQLENLSADNIVGQTIPTTIDNGSPIGDVLAVDPVQVRTFINKIVGPSDPALVSARPVAPTTVSVTVRNGGSTNGAGARAVSQLSDQGFQASLDSSSVSSPDTVIEYLDGMQAQAKTLAQFVPGASLQRVDSVHQLTLLLGGDGLGVSVPTATGSASSGAPPSSSAAPSSPAPTPTRKPTPIDAGCIN